MSKIIERVLNLTVLTVSKSRNFCISKLLCSLSKNFNNILANPLQKIRTNQTDRLINTLLVMCSQQLSVTQYWMNKLLYLNHSSSQMPFFQKYSLVEVTYPVACFKGEWWCWWWWSWWWGGRWWGNVTFPHIFKNSVGYMQNIVGNSKSNYYSMGQ